MNSFPILSRDGLLLAGYHWPSKISKSPCALLILIHGVAEHSGRYEYLIEYYNKNNFAVMTMDLRGHGQSAGKPVFIPTAEAIFQDMDLLVRKARRIYPFCPAVLYGHSMGGSLVLSYTLDRFPNERDQCPYKAIVVTSPWIRLARPYQPPRPLYAIIRAFCRIHPSYNIKLRFDPHKITRDEETITAYEKDGNIRRSATLSLARTIGSIAAKLDRAKCI
jgi:alpha-beta hydrolase superfamily lysophospholipase